jgi:hypothetical protein
MKINRVELDKIHEVLKNFPDVNDIEIVRDGSSGIGYILSIKFKQQVHGVDAVVEIEITGVENW